MNSDKLSNLQNLKNIPNILSNSPILKVDKCELIYLKDYLLESINVVVIIFNSVVQHLSTNNNPITN